MCYFESFKIRKFQLINKLIRAFVQSTTSHTYLSTFHTGPSGNFPYPGIDP